MTLKVRPAIHADTPFIFAMIRELADYERLLHDVHASEAMIETALFGPSPRVFCDIAEHEGERAGIALWFYNFSTFKGLHGIYLEDLFVRPAMRGKGLGKALLAGLARRCAAEGLGRMQWSVLDWNIPSIDFYKSLGAVLDDDWTTCRIQDEALARLARA